jgi:hypothetical protein
MEVLSMGRLLEIADSVMAQAEITGTRNTTTGEEVLRLVRVWLRRIGETDPKIIKEITGKARTDPAALAWYLDQERETRVDPQRAEVLTLLQGDPACRYAYLVTDPDADPVEMMIAIRGIGTAALTIPRDQFDAGELLDFIRARGQ